MTTFNDLNSKHLVLFGFYIVPSFVVGRKEKGGTISGQCLPLRLTLSPYDEAEYLPRTPPPSLDTGVHHDQHAERDDKTH